MATKAKNKVKKPRNPVKPGKKGRKLNGQFTKGNKVGLGNSNAANSKVQKLKDAVLAAVSVASIKVIIEKQIEKAKEGNNQSAKIILDRCLGKPTEIYEVGGKDGKPIQVSIVDFAKINDDTK